MRRDMRRSGEDERWREGAADRKLWKERTERVGRQYFTRPSTMYSRDQGGRAYIIFNNAKHTYTWTHASGARTYTSTHTYLNRVDTSRKLCN